MRSVVISAIAVLIATFARPSLAFEIGDTFYISNGIERTITKLVQGKWEFIEIEAQVLKKNAIESCENFMMIKPNTKELDKCVARTIGKPERYKVFCEKPAIITGGVTYRPSRGDETSDPWKAVNNPNLIIKGQNLFELICG